MSLQYIVIEIIINSNLTKLFIPETNLATSVITAFENKFFLAELNIQI